MSVELKYAEHESLGAAFGSWMREHYRRTFSMAEVYDDLVLKWFAGAIMLGFYVTFNSWMLNFGTTTRAVRQQSYLCWPLFQDCSSLIWLSTLPDGYSQTTLYMCLFGVMIAGVYMMYEQRWEVVHGCLVVLFLAKLYFMLVNYQLKGNYDYYHNVFCLIYLLFPSKKFFLRFVLVFFYFLSTATKIHPSWVAGQYFTALQTGLPLFPAGTEALATNLVIFMEMIGAWFLFSRHVILQRAVFYFFVVFHLYSGILVGYRYPATVLPPLIILFGPWFKPPAFIPMGKGAIPGWSLMGLLCIGQMVPHLIRGDEKLTLEGNFFGLYMFEANHQCYVTVQRPGEPPRKMTSVNARDRCDPYEYWFRAKHSCNSPNDEISMVMGHSINGGPFREIVNEKNICKLEYTPFMHNSWIKDETEAPITGKPVKNIYR